MGKRGVILFVIFFLIFSLIPFSLSAEENILSISLDIQDSKFSLNQKVIEGGVFTSPTISVSDGYTLNLIGNDDLPIFSQKFSLDQSSLETPENIGLLFTSESEGLIEFTLPHNENAKKVEILDPSGKIVFKTDMNNLEPVQRNTGESTNTNNNPSKKSSINFSLILMIGIPILIILVLVIILLRSRNNDSGGVVETGMPNKSGQVAMEFLMTYGWAIIIIVIAVAALFVLLGGFGGGSPNQCNAEAPFNCGEIRVEDRGEFDEVSITLKAGEISGSRSNNKVESILVNGVPCLFSETDKTSLPHPDPKLDARKSFQTYACTTTGDIGGIGETFSGQIEIVYEKKSGGGLTRKSNIPISGEIERSFEINAEDYNQDGVVDEEDLALLDLWDYNRDGVVDDEDILLLTQYSIGLSSFEDPDDPPTGGAILDITGNVVIPSNEALDVDGDGTPGTKEDAALLDQLINNRIIKDQETFIKYGDVNNDGKVTAYDRDLILKYRVGAIDLTWEQVVAADVTGNGQVSAFDASWIISHAGSWYRHTLRPGNNLISLFGYPDNVIKASTIKSKFNQITDVCQQDTTDRSNLVWDCSQDFTLKLGKSYLVKVDESLPAETELIWYYEHTIKVGEAKLDLKQGWNTVGVPFSRPTDDRAYELLDQIPEITEFRKMNLDGTFDIITVNGGVKTGDDFSFYPPAKEERGEGYLAYVSSDVVWPPNAAPITALDMNIESFNFDDIADGSLRFPESMHFDMRATGTNLERLATPVRLEFVLESGRVFSRGFDCMVDEILFQGNNVYSLQTIGVDYKFDGTLIPEIQSMNSIECDMDLTNVREMEGESITQFNLVFENDESDRVEFNYDPQMEAHKLVPGENLISLFGEPILPLHSQSIITDNSDITSVCQLSRGTPASPNWDCASDFELIPGKAYKITLSNGAANPTPWGYYYRIPDRPVIVEISGGLAGIGIPYHPTDLTSNDVLSDISGSTNMYKMDSSGTLISTSFNIKSGEGYLIESTQSKTRFIGISDANPGNKIHRLDPGINLISLFGTPTDPVSSQGLLDDYSFVQEVCQTPIGEPVINILNPDLCNSKTDASKNLQFNLEVGKAYYIITDLSISNQFISYKYTDLVAPVGAQFVNGLTFFGVPYSDKEYTSNSLIEELMELSGTTNPIKIFRFKDSGVDTGFRLPAFDHFIGTDFPLKPGEGYGATIITDTPINWQIPISPEKIYVYSSGYDWINQRFSLCLNEKPGYEEFVTNLGIDNNQLLYATFSIPGTSINIQNQNFWYSLLNPHQECSTRTFSLTDTQIQEINTVYPNGITPVSYKFELGYGDPNVNPRTEVLSDTKDFDVKVFNDNTVFKVGVIQIVPPGYDLDKQLVCFVHPTYAPNTWEPASISEDCNIRPENFKIADAVWQAKPKKIIKLTDLIWADQISTEIDDLVGNELIHGDGRVTTSSKVYSIKEADTYLNNMLANQGLNDEDTILKKNPTFEFIMLNPVEQEYTIEDKYDDKETRAFFDKVIEDHNIDISAYDFTIKIIYVPDQPEYLSSKIRGDASAQARDVWVGFHVRADFIIQNQGYNTLVHEFGHMAFGGSDLYSGFGAKYRSGVPNPTPVIQENACLMTKFFGDGEIGTNIMRAYNTNNYFWFMIENGYMVVLPDHIGPKKYYTSDPGNYRLCVDTMYKFMGKTENPTCTRSQFYDGLCGESCTVENYYSGGCIAT